MSIEIINGRRVGITRSGEGAPMLMLHCALAHRGVLAPLMAKMPAHAFTTFDMPGHGESEFDAAVDIQGQAVETAICLLEANGPSDVFGHSFGATVALKLALERPDLVRKVCLYEPVYFAVLAGANPEAYAAETRASAAFTKATLAKDWPAAARAFLARWSIEGFDNIPSAQKTYILKTIPLIMASNASIILPESGAEVLKALAMLSAPVLLMKGAKSPKVIAQIATVLADHGPAVTLVTLPKAAHMGPITHAGGVAQVVASFLD